MKLDIVVHPDTEEEAEFLSLLSEAREFGVEETTLTEAEVASVFSQFASGLSTEFDSPKEKSSLDCPQCGEPVEEVEADGMGVDPTIQPCGHVVDWADLPADLYS